MQFGISLPTFGAFAQPRVLVELSIEAEMAGWDGFFVWDHLLFDPMSDVAVADPWIALSAIAQVTERVRVGPLVTALARRRPWKVARETVTLDHLSNGRTVLGVGLGYPAESEFGIFGEESNDRIRAEKLDEGLLITTGLWSGETFQHNGEHSRVGPVRFLPTPIQQPRIPIWVGGYWPNRGPMRRAARWDGVMPLSRNVNWDEPIPTHELRDLLEYVYSHRTSDAPFDVVVGGFTPGDEQQQALEIVNSYADAGATWWVEFCPDFGDADPMRRRIQQGPPRDS